MAKKLRPHDSILRLAMFQELFELAALNGWWMPGERTLYKSHKIPVDVAWEITTVLSGFTPDKGANRAAVIKGIREIKERYLEKLFYEDVKWIIENRPKRNQIVPLKAIKARFYETYKDILYPAAAGFRFFGEVKRGHGTCPLKQEFEK